MAGIQDLLNRPASVVNQLSAEQLRKDTQQLADAANKRLKRLGETEEGRRSPAYQSAQRRSYNTGTGGKFGVSDINARYQNAMEQLRQRYQETAAFLKKKSSSKRELKKSLGLTEKRIGIKLPSFVKQSEFWRAYRMLEEEYYISSDGVYDSGTVQKDLRKLMQGRTSTISAINRNNMMPKGVLDKDVRERDESARLLAKSRVIRLADGTNFDIGKVRTAEDIHELGRILMDAFGSTGRQKKRLPIIDTDVT